MTQIIEILSKKVSQNSFEILSSTIIAICKQQGIQIIQRTNNTYKYIVKLEDQGGKREEEQQYFLVGSIKIGAHTVEIEGEFYEQMVKKVRAQTQYHKIAILQYFNTIIKNQYFSFKVHPLTGQMKVNYSTFYKDFANIENIIHTMAQYLPHELPQFSSKIFRILETKSTTNLQIVKASFLVDYATNPPILLSSQKSRIQETEHSKNHAKHFFNFKKEQEYLNHWEILFSNVTQETFNSYIGIETKKLMKSKDRKSNISYMNNDKLLWELASFKKLRYYSSIIWSSPHEQGQREIRIKIEKKNTNKITEEYSIVNKFAQKGYFTFLKDYVLFNQRADYHNIILTHYQQEVDFQEFLIFNQHCLSFEAKLDIAINLIGIVYLYELYFQGSIPVLKQNLIMCNQQLKIKELKELQKKSYQQFFEYLGEIFFPGHYIESQYINKNKTLQSIRNQGNFGPSLLVVWIRQIIVDSLRKEKISLYSVRELFYLFSRIKEIVHLRLKSRIYEDDHEYPPSYWFAILI